MRFFAAVAILLCADLHLVHSFIAPHASTGASFLSRQQMTNDLGNNLVLPRNESLAGPIFEEGKTIKFVTASNILDSDPVLTASDISESNAVLTTNEILVSGENKGIFFNEVDNGVTSSDEKRNHKIITVDGKQYVNFATCSYMGVEVHPKVIGAIKYAAEMYGSQFCTSRAYMSHRYYNEAEALLGEIFGRPALISVTTTLGHMSALPILIGDDDAIIIDQQVHNSVQTAAQLVKARGVPISVSRHNDMKHLEQKIAKLAAKHKKVWFLADGVYSMYGDYADFEGLNALLEKFKTLHIYMDDAHGVSWYGKHGKGIVGSMMGHHDRLVVAVSLSKSFGAAGGAIIFPNEAQRSLVRHTGGPMLFSAPIGPPMLAAIKASLEFHLSEEAAGRQEKLLRLIGYTNELLREKGVPQYAENNSPVLFIPIGAPEPCIDLVNRVTTDGFYVNTATYPATPVRRGGLRFMINCHLEESDLRGLVSSIASHYGDVLSEHGITTERISRDFKIPMFSLNSVSPTDDKSPLSTKIYRSIHDLDRDEWDAIFTNIGSNMNSKAMALQEDTFADKATGTPENEWDFYYIVVRDTTNNNKIIGATIFTEALAHNDLLSSSFISKRIKEKRSENPYFLTEKILLNGSVLTTGEHFYLDETSSHWKSCTNLVIDTIVSLQEKNEANQVIFRSDHDFGSLMLDKGLSKIVMPATHIVSGMNAWKTRDDFMNDGLNTKQRNDFKRSVAQHLDQFEVVSGAILSEMDVLQCYNLYCKVWDRSTEISTFKMPISYFRKTFLECGDQYDVIRVYSKSKDLVGFVISERQTQKYTGNFIGFEKDSVGKSVNLYRVLMYFAIMRAWELGYDEIELGYSASVAKRKLGAKRIEQNGYSCYLDHFLTESELNSI